MKRHTLLLKAGMLLSVVWFAAVSVWMAFVWYQAPCVVSVDVRGKGMDVEAVERWRAEWNQNKKIPGILGVTGWRWEREGEAYAPDTGQRRETRVIGVCGKVTDRMSFAGKLLAGTRGLEREKSCLISGELAEGLFGSWDVAGSKVGLGSRQWEIAGVVECEGRRLMIPVEAGELDWVEVCVGSRRGMRDVMEDLRN